MGLFGFVGKQFIDVIEWLESTEQGDILAYRYPIRDQEIQNGAKLTVRDTQQALFVNEGIVADLFAPGLHTLTTNTLPILTNLKNWDKAFASPFKSDVYFFSMRPQLDQKWGTPNHITVRDPEFGPVRIQAFGNYVYKIGDVKSFFKTIVGTREAIRSADLDGQLRAAIITAFTNFIATAKVPFLDMAANVGAFSTQLHEALKPSFTTLGLTLDSFTVQNLSLPEELTARLDERASQQMVGDLGNYARFQAAKSIPAAAANTGGAAGAGVGIGAGAALGQMMADSLRMGGTVASAATEDPLATIEKLHTLHKAGAISATEFESKKSELLKKIS